MEGTVTWKWAVTVPRYRGIGDLFRVARDGSESCSTSKVARLLILQGDPLGRPGLPVPRASASEVKSDTNEAVGGDRESGGVRREVNPHSPWSTYDLQAARVNNRHRPRRVWVDGVDYLLKGIVRVFNALYGADSGGWCERPKPKIDKVG